MARPDRTPRAAQGARRGVPRRALRARRGRRRAALPAGLVVALLTTGAAVYVGLDRHSPDPASRSTGGRAASSPSAGGASTASPSASPTEPPADLATVSIPRQPFCDRLPDDDVEQALGAPVASTYHYDNGERRHITGSLTDVAHEDNCTFAAADGTQARAWVFAAPVDQRAAAGLVRDASGADGCGPLTRPPTFGRPGVATLCHEHGPTAVAVTLSGLFGDAWFSCRLSTPGRAGAVATTTRAEQWCVRVATTLAAQP
jgi:hypothetical protein